jgi:hypothetical protein
MEARKPQIKDHLWYRPPCCLTTWLKDKEEEREQQMEFQPEVLLPSALIHSRVWDPHDPITSRVPSLNTFALGMKFPTSELWGANSNPSQHITDETQ